MARSFTVEKNENIPTHKILTLEIEEENRDEETMQLRKLQSVKARIDDLMKDYTKGCDEKEARDIRRHHLALLHGFIDEQLWKKQSQLRKHEKNGDTQTFWEVWTRNVEKGILKHLADCGVETKGNKGRGYVNIFAQKSYEAWKDPQKGEDIGHLKTKEAQKSLNYLKQARRCEQYVHRLKLKTEGNAKETHKDLNKQAAANIIRASLREEQWETDFIVKLMEVEEESQNDTILTPMLQRAAEKYQEEQERWRRKAVDEKLKEKRGRYRDRTRGQWNIAQDLGKQGRRP